MRQEMIDDITYILGVVSEWPREVRLSDPGAYKLGYAALRKFFDTKLDFENIDDIRAGGYAVYGWMPRILRRWAADETLLALGQLAITARTKPRDVVRLALGQLPPSPSSMLAFNNSSVGTTKFLHFAAPAVFPIWDSVVASNFSLTKKSELSRHSHYVDYFDAIHACIEDNARTRELLLPLMLPGVTKVRSLEYLLFRYGQEQIAAGRRKAAKNTE